VTRALVLIHGIGEQRPMKTMWCFLQGVFDLDANGTGAWVIGSHEPVPIVARSKPDRLSGNFELRRVNVEAVRKEEEKLFESWHCYELFWQHVFRDHGFLAILDWLFGIIVSCRPLGSIRLAILRIAVLPIFLLLLAWVAFPDTIEHILRTIGKSIWAWIISWPVVYQAILWFLVLVLAIYMLRTIIRLIVFGPVVFRDAVGDAASYLDGHPRNVAKRNAVRSAGQQLIARLHAQRQPRYSEIIVVGHSLGSVIGYDVLYSVWQDMDRKVNDAKLVDRLEGAAQPLADDSKPSQVRGYAQQAERYRKLREEYQKCQEELFKKLNGSLEKRWRVSRFVSMGSPLTHAQFLLASDADTLKCRQRRREFPRCPPSNDMDSTQGYRFSFGDQASRTLHHAALFAPTMWTNIYFPRRCLFAGDLIGGPVAKWFGDGIKDVRLASKGGHTSYWNEEHAVRAVRQAVGLDGEPAPRTGAAAGRRSAS
jgi:hypothetical protein